MDVTNGAWFSHAETLATVGLVGALCCAVLAIIFLIKQYKGHVKAAKMTRLFLILGLIFLLVARFAPQENEVISQLEEKSETGVEHKTTPEIGTAIEGALEHDVHDFTHKVESDVDTALDEDNKEIQSLEDEFTSEMNEDEGEINAGLHGGVEKETDVAIDDVVDYVDIPDTPKTTEGHKAQSVTQAAEPYTVHGIEQEALTAMREHALVAAQAVDGVHSASWNKSMLPDLELDVVANVTPETAIPLMNTLCTSLTDNIIQPTTVSIKDLEGGQIARQMCGTLVQGVE